MYINKQLLLTTRSLASLLLKLVFPASTFDHGLVASHQLTSLTKCQLAQLDMEKKPYGSVLTVKPPKLGSSSDTWFRYFLVRSHRDWLTFLLAYILCASPIAGIDFSLLVIFSLSDFVVLPLSQRSIERIRGLPCLKNVATNNTDSDTQPRIEPLSRVHSKYRYASFLWTADFVKLLYHLRELRTHIHTMVIVHVNLWQVRLWLGCAPRSWFSSHLPCTRSLTSV